RPEPFERPLSAHRRAYSPNSVCCRSQPISVSSASTRRLRLCSYCPSSVNKMKLRRDSASGTSLGSTLRHTIGAKRLLSDDAYSISCRQTCDDSHSGLSENTTVSAWLISDCRRCHQSSKA